jgi:hypothetical protein
MHRFEAQIGAVGSFRRIEVIQLRIGETIAGVLRQVRHRNVNRKPSQFLTALVFRLPVSQSFEPDQFKDSTNFSNLSDVFGQREGQDWQSAFNRIRQRSVHILGSCDGQHFITPNMNPHWSLDDLTGLDTAEILTCIRRAEFDYVLDNADAVLVEHAGAAYKVPSGNVARSFLRVGNIQYDRDAIDAAIFWLLPRLKNCAGIMTDTWSISSIALAASRLAAQYFGGPPCPVELLRSYHDGSVKARSQTSESIKHLVTECEKFDPDKKRLLCLISASHTGQLKGTLKDVFDADHTGFEIDYVCLFLLSKKNKMECLHDLSDDPRFALLTEAEQASRTQILIDPQMYFPRGFQDVEIKIEKKTADHAWNFLENYKGQGIIKVHRNHSDHSVSRHHAIHLDTAKMFETQKFQQSLRKKLQSLDVRPVAIVHPLHQAGRKLGELCQAYFSELGSKIPTIAHDTLDIHEVDANDGDNHIRDALGQLTDDDAILILDDACITGRRLAGFQKSLRSQIKFRGRICYLVGVARPENGEVWNDHLRYLPFRDGTAPPHIVEHVEFILLPNWDDKECPWCKEHDFLLDCVNDPNFPETLRTRQQRLADARENGLTGELFLEFADKCPMELGPSSLFVTSPATQADAFAGVAAAIQQLREPNTGQPPLVGRQFPIATVLKQADYLKAKWTDSILRASFLRAADSDELIYATEKKELKRTKEMRTLMMQDAKREYDVTLDFLLAAAMGKCDLADDQDFLEKIRSYGKTEIVDFLVGQFEKRKSGNGG